MGIARSSVVSPKAKIGTRATIGDFTIVHDNVILGDDVVIDSHCIIGYPTPAAEGKALLIGNNALIRSHSIFYEGSTIGPELRTGHSVTVREKIEAGRNLQIGSHSYFQGHTKIGDYVRMQDSIHMGQKTEIGSFVWIFPCTVFTNDPHPPSDGFLRGVVVEDYAIIAALCCLLPGVRVGACALVAAHSLVTKDVEPNTVVGGVPAKKLCMTSDVKLRDGSGNSAYPWMRHFHRGYPKEIIAAWKREYGSLGKA
jgi:acetyltransferase-like isoleucine patch superfamily enzyme